MLSTISKLVSGGQTGADVAAWDAALSKGIPTGGWVPRGRTNEAGQIPSFYPGLLETRTADVKERTEANVKASGATLIFSNGPLKGGSLFTLEKAQQHQKELMHIDFERIGEEEVLVRLKKWLEGLPEKCVLNVAGPRHSEDPTIYARVRGVLEVVL